MKSKKGITLVALIITIIILLILAVVSITALSGDHIIQHAENASDTYNNAMTAEKGQIQNYETYLNNKISKSKILNPIQNTLKTTINVGINEAAVYRYTYTGEIASIKLNGENYITLQDGSIIMGTKNGELVHTTLEKYDTYKIAGKQNFLTDSYLLKVAAEPNDGTIHEQQIDATIEITFSDGASTIDHCVFAYEYII